MPGIHIDLFNEEEEDDDFDDLMIFPITDVDNDNDADDEDEGGPYLGSKKFMPKEDGDKRGLGLPRWPSDAGLIRRQSEVPGLAGLPRRPTEVGLFRRPSEVPGLGLPRRPTEVGLSRRPSYVSLRQRRYSQLGLGTGPLLKLNVDHLSQLSQQAQQSTFESEDELDSFPPTMSLPKRRWLMAFRKLRNLKDPWEKFHIDDLPTERAIRHRYNALRNQWKEDEVVIKMEDEPFNHGAMRSCFRLKKTSKACRNKNGKIWKNALNYVAKRYMEDVDRDVYFEDVRLQMDAKLWGEEYNRHNPPKKVDIFQMYVLEFTDRPGRPLYHLEHFIEGNYIKYNSNSGFVEESLRLTPQAFSHFTFERSGHKMIVVDIQGVGDLWTDPQIHTAEGTEYGDGNLGSRGMALFFHSHVCNSICESLQLTKFDLSPSEEKTQQSFIAKQVNIPGAQATRVRGCENMVICASPSERVNLTSFLNRQRSRTMSSCSSAISEESESARQTSEDEPMTPGSPVMEMDVSPFRPRRIRFLSESESDSASATMTESTKSANGDPDDESYDDFSMEEDRVMFMRAASKMARPSCVAHEINLRNLHNFRQQEDSMLGQIHHELAKYHEIGRFLSSQDEELDMEAAIYHEQQAADLGIKEAILTMAYLYLGLPHDILVNCTIEQSDDNIIQGVDYMIMAADVGDRGAMIYMAKAFENGYGLGSNRTQSYKEAVRWYKLAVNTTQQDESGEFDATMDNPLYMLQAKIAELYLEGGYGLEKDPTTAAEYYNEAAENAMAAMKGRLANKYYALSEEAYALVEEE